MGVTDGEMTNQVILDMDAVCYMLETEEDSGKMKEINKIGQDIYAQLIQRDANYKRAIKGKWSSVIGESDVQIMTFLFLTS